MNITYMIGNGFDIAAGMKTRYSDFLNWYIKQPSEYDHIAKFKESIATGGFATGELWSDVEVALGKYTGNYGLDSIELFYICYEDLRNQLMNYLREEQIWIAPAQDIPTKSIMKEISTFYKDIHPVFQEGIIQRMQQSQRNNFNFLIFNYTNTLDQILTGEGVQGVGITPIGKVIHVHGTVDYYPILGVCSTAQIGNPELFADDDFQTIMIKSESQKEKGDHIFDEAAELISSSDIIVIYGLSLGKTDFDWWSLIRHWKRADPARTLIIYWYDTSQGSTKYDTVSLLEKRRIQRNGMPIYEPVREKLDSYGIPYDNNTFAVVNPTNFGKSLHDLDTSKKYQSIASTLL